MITKIIAVRDIVANVYSQPMFVANLGGAIRSWQDQINGGKENPYADHPDHYELFHLGEFNDEDCTFSISSKPVQIATGSNLVRAKQ